MTMFATTTMFTLLTALVLAAPVIAAPAPADDPPLRVVPQLDLERYAGRWFEIARFPNRFQRSCATEVSATYTLRPDGRITVLNRCRQANGEMKEAEGVARRVDQQPPSVLKVRFAPAFLSFLPMVWGDYQVIALGGDYDYAVVGTPDRAYLWVLSRTPQMDAERYQAALDEARAQGFDIARLVRTEQAPAVPD